MTNKPILTISKTTKILLAVVLILCVSTIPLLTSFVRGQQNPQVTVSASVRDTIVVFQGFTFPLAFVTVKDGTTTVGTVTANSTGYFSKEIKAVSPGNHTFNVTSRDGNNIETSPASYNLNIVSQTTTTVSNIIIPSTINSNKTSLQINESFSFFGSAYRNSTVNIYAQGVGLIGTTTTSSQGIWSKGLTANFGSGTFNLYAVVTTGGGLTSSNSKIITITVAAAPSPTPTRTPTPTPTATPLPTATPRPTGALQPTATPTVRPTSIPSPTPTTRSCRRSDLNCDTKVNLVDFSILLYHWGTNHDEADINNDGAVNLTDFSIMLFDWTG